MRRVVAALTLISAVGLTPLAAMAQEVGPVANNQPVKAPKLVLDRTGHDFGVLYEDAGKQRTKFIFVNEGDADLNITNVATTCGCTTPEMEKRLYAPGESGELIVYYDPHNRKGPQNRKVTIHSDDPSSPRMPITIQANVKRMVEIEPAIVRLGQVPKGETRTMMVDITGRAPGFKVTNTEVLRIKGLDVEILEPMVIEEEDGTATQVTLMLNLGKGQDIGSFQGALSLEMTDGTGKVSNKNISILGEILGDLKASPKQFNVGSVEAGAVVERHFSIISRELRPFKILKIEERPLMGIDQNPRPAALEGLSFEAIPENPDRPAKYMVRYKFQSKPEVVRQFFTQLVFHTDRKDQPEIVVRVLGRINNPVLIPSPTNDGHDHKKDG